MQPPSGHAICAFFIFLDLPEPDADQFSELQLRKSALLTESVDTLTDLNIYRVGRAFVDGNFLSDHRHYLPSSLRHGAPWWDALTGIKSIRLICLRALVNVTDLDSILIHAPDGSLYGSRLPAVEPVNRLRPRRLAAGRRRRRVWALDTFAEIKRESRPRSNANSSLASYPAKASITFGSRRRQTTERSMRRAVNRLPHFTANRHSRGSPASSRASIFRIQLLDETCVRAFAVRRERDLEPEMPKRPMGARVADHRSADRPLRLYFSHNYAFSSLSSRRVWCRSLPSAPSISASAISPERCRQVPRPQGLGDPRRLDGGASRDSAFGQTVAL